MKDIFYGVAILIGTIIGAGVLSLPYAYMKSGFPLGLLSLIVAEALMISTSLFLVEMGRRGDEIPDIFRRYIGRWGEIISTISLILLCMGAIMAYNVGVGTIIESLVGIPSWVGMLPIVILLAFLGWRGIRAVAGSESILIILLTALMIGLSIYLLPGIKMKNISTFDPRFFFYALGASIFAVSGYSAVPELLKIGDKRRMVTAVLLAHLIVFLLYLSFSLAFVGKYGINVKQIAVENLSGALKVFGLILAAIAMLTSYLSLGFILFNVFKQNVGIEKIKGGKLISIFLAYIFPYILAYSTKFGFADLISFTGDTAMPLTGILVGLSYIRFSKKKLGKACGLILSGVYLVILIEVILRALV